MTAFQVWHYRSSASPGTTLENLTSHPHFLTSCHNHDTQSTLYHSVQLHPHVYCPFHCMYLSFPIISILLVSPPIGECFVHSVSPYDYLICFHLRFRLLTVPIPRYLLIQYASGNWSRTSPSLLIMLRKLHSSLFVGMPDPPSITLYILL